MSSAARQPADHTSTFGEYPLIPNSNYGARYQRVTTFTVDSFLNFLARPKSANLTSPNQLSNTLEGFKSLCATLRESRYCKPSRTCLRTCCILEGVISICLFQMILLRSHSMRSRHRQSTGGLFLATLSQTTSLMLRMLGWLSPCRSLIQRSVVMGKPNSLLSSKFYIFLRAQQRSFWKFLALQTEPYVPLPSYTSVSQYLAEI